MSIANEREFDKMPEFIECIFNVFKMVNKKEKIHHANKKQIIGFGSR